MEVCRSIKRSKCEGMRRSGISLFDKYPIILLWAKVLYRLKDNSETIPSSVLYPNRYIEKENLYYYCGMGQKKDQKMIVRFHSFMP